MLFTGDGRPLTHAWRGAWDRVEEGRPATVLELAQERKAREERENDESLKDRVSAFREDTSRRHQTGSRAGLGKKGKDGDGPKSGESRATGTGDDTEDVPPRRDLVSPDRLRLRDKEGQHAERTEGRKLPRKTHRGGLVEPGGPATPKTRATPPNYTSEEKERLGLKLLERVVGRELVDVRAKRGVGADALDEEEGRYYELKVSGGSEPDVVSLTASEVMRAAEADDKFVLAVVSGVEGDDACPTVRLVLDPLRELEAATEDGKINLAGVRRSQGLIYQFDNDGVEGTRGDIAGISRVGGGQEALWRSADGCCVCLVPE